MSHRLISPPRGGIKKLVKVMQLGGTRGNHIEIRFKQDNKGGPELSRCGTGDRVETSRFGALSNAEPLERLHLDIAQAQSSSSLNDTPVCFPLTIDYQGYHRKKQLLYE